MENWFEDDGLWYAPHEQAGLMFGWHRCDGDRESAKRVKVDGHNPTEPIRGYSVRPNGENHCNGPRRWEIGVENRVFDVYVIFGHWKERVDVSNCTINGQVLDARVVPLRQER